jgi:hypothetical protein
MTDNDIRREVLACLEYQRSSVRSVVAGLDEDAWHKPVVPSGWNIAGMVEHIGGAEWHWFHAVVADKPLELPGDDEDLPPYDPETVVFFSDSPSSEVLAFYREVCDQSDEILAGFGLSDAPRALHRHPGAEITSVHGVILHVIEETAAHSGHLEIARELLDGATRRGMR